MSSSSNGSYGWAAASGETGEAAPGQPIHVPCRVASTGCSAVISASAGYILGLRAKHHRAASQPAAVVTSAPAPSKAQPAAKACIAESERDAKQKYKSPGGLAQVFYLLTDRDEVSICRDSAGVLFYQGHVR